MVGKGGSVVLVVICSLGQLAEITLTFLPTPHTKTSVHIFWLTFCNSTATLEGPSIRSFCLTDSSVSLSQGWRGALLVVVVVMMMAARLGEVSDGGWSSEETITLLIRAGILRKGI